MASAPSHANRRNAVRFDLLEDLQMDRLQFSRQILQKELGISTNQLDYLFAFPGKKIFEVIFTTTQHYESCLEKFEKKKSAPSFRRITISPLADIDLKTVHVMIFSERVRNQDVWTWMARYCEVINAMEVMDIDGIKTGTRRFQVRLIRRQGALQHLPNTIQLGAFRGSVFYPGQPKECRKCGSLDHLAAACTMDVCRNCKALDHTTAHCPTPVKCNLCSSANHRFKDCPQAYSNRLKLSTLRSAVSLSQEVMSEIPDDDQAPIPHANQVQQPPTTALQQQSEQPAFDLEEDMQDGAQVVDWSAELSEDDDDVSNSSSSTTAPLALHQAEHLSSSKIELTRMTLQEAGNLSLIHI